jgi:hypothetical protein
MSCRTIHLPGRGTAIVCGPRVRRLVRHCVVCHCLDTLCTMKLCDGPRAGGNRGRRVRLRCVLSMRGMWNLIRTIVPSMPPWRPRRVSQRVRWGHRPYDGLWYGLEGFSLNV